MRQLVWQLLLSAGEAVVVASRQQVQAVIVDNPALFAEAEVQAEEALNGHHGPNICRGFLCIHLKHKYSKLDLRCILKMICADLKGLKSSPGDSQTHSHFQYIEESVFLQNLCIPVPGDTTAFM